MNIKPLTFPNACGTVWAMAMLISLILMLVTWYRNKESRGMNPRIELIYILLPAIFAIGPNIVHLVAVQNRITAPLLEIVVFGAWWYAVFQWNMKSKQWCSTRILVSFALQWSIMYLLRSFVY